MGASNKLICKLDKLDPQIKDAFLCLVAELDEKAKVVSIGSADITALINAVQSLTKAQDSTDHQVKKLTEAQDRTDHQVKKLTEAQERTEHRMEEFTKAQARTEHRMEEFTKAQDRTEHRMEEFAKAQKKLTEAQSRTEEQIKELSETMKLMAEKQHTFNRQLGGLSMTIGYGIEDKLIPNMAAVAQAEFKITVSIVDRRNIIYDDGKYDEINLYCEGIRDGKPVYLIGEAKAQPGKKDFNKFSKILKRLHNHLQCDIEAFMVGYQYSPDVEIYADEHYPDIRRYKTFQILK